MDMKPLQTLEDQLLLPVFLLDQVVRVPADVDPVS